MRTAKVFMNGGSQAVRLPKEYQLDADEVCINKVGDALIIFPKDKGWEIMMDSLNKFSSDFPDCVPSETGLYSEVED
jgi:antitoxin VapB